MRHLNSFAIHLAISTPSDSTKDKYMECSTEMAESLLRKWQDEFTVLVVRLAGYGFSATMGGTISVVDAGEGVEISGLAIRASTGEIVIAPSSMVVGLRDASFEFLTSREAPEDLREQSMAIFESVLKAIVPAAKKDEEPNYVLTLTEMRDQ